MNKQRLLLRGLLGVTSPYAPYSQLKFEFELKEIYIEFYACKPNTTNQFILYITPIDPNMFKALKMLQQSSRLGGFRALINFYKDTIHTICMCKITACQLIFENSYNNKSSIACSHILKYLLSLNYGSPPCTIVTNLLKIIFKV
jgi:hypothetical protein